MNAKICDRCGLVEKIDGKVKSKEKSISRIFISYIKDSVNIRNKKEKDEEDFEESYDLCGDCDSLLKDFLQPIEVEGK